MASICMNVPSSNVTVSTEGLSVHPAAVQASTENPYSVNGNSPVTLYSTVGGSTSATSSPSTSTV